jgi:hypothetical protein
MTGIYEAVGTAGISVAKALAAEPDLDLLQAALVRERVIRDVMRDSGEERQHVADMLDAMRSMADEAVLDLMEGEPTTLHAGLQRYVEELRGRDELEPRDRVVDDLETLLAYSWPGKNLELEDDGPDYTVVKIGGNQVARVEHEGGTGVEDAVTAVHRELTSTDN